MERLYKIVEETAEFYNSNPIEWFTIIAMDGDVILRMDVDEFKKHPELTRKCTVEEKEEGVNYSKEIRGGLVQSFMYVPKEDKVKDIWNNILSLDAEWYLPDSIKWMMYDYWTTLCETQLRRQKKHFTMEQEMDLERIRKAIHYVE